MTKDEQNKRLHELVDKEFLDKLVEVASLGPGSISIDYYEVKSFILQLYYLKDIPSPGDFDVYSEG